MATTAFWGRYFIPLLWLGCASLAQPQPILPGEDDLLDVIGPQNAIASADGSRIYALSPLSNSVIVFDTRSNRITANIRTDITDPPGLWPTRAVLSPDGSRLYTANFLNKTVSVIDTAADRAIATVTLASWAHDVAVTADGRFIVVDIQSDRVPVIDAKTLTVARTVVLQPNDVTYSVAAVPNSAEVCVTSQVNHAAASANSRIYCLNAATGVAVDRIELNRSVYDHGRLGVLPDGDTILLPSGQTTSESPVPGVTSPSTLYVVRRSEHRVVQDLSVMGAVTNFRLSPDGRTAVYLNNQDGYILDLATLSVAGLLDWSSPTADHGVLARDHLKDVAFLPDGRAYVLCENPSVFFMADLKTLKVAGSFPIRSAALKVWDGLLSPDGKTFSVTTQYADGTALGSVFLVDTAGRKVRAETVPRFYPNFLTRGPRTGLIYVTSTSSLLALSPETGRIERELSPDKELGYNGVAISPDEKRAYLAAANDHFLVALDLESGKIAGKIDVGWNPQMVAVTGDGNTIIVSRQISTHDDGGLTFLDAGTLTVTAKLNPPVAWGARGRIDILTFSPDRKTLYWGGGNYIHVIDVAKRSVVTSIDFNSIEFQPPRTPHHPSSMAFSPDGKTAYVSCGDSASVAIVDLTRNVVTGFIYAVGLSPAAIAISTAGDVLYVNCTDEVVVVDIASRKRIARIPVVSGGALSGAGIVNAASLISGAVSPGEILTLFGSGIGPPDLLVATAVDGRVPTSLDGVTVAVDGFPAPILYARSDQVSAIAPYACCAGSSVQVDVAYAGRRTSIVTAAALVHPAIFTADGSGIGQAAALNQDGSFNGRANPARGGEIITFFATGLGAANSTVVDGQLAEPPLPAPSRLVRVSFGGVETQVLYAGAAPGQVMGLWQINARIPTGLEGDVQVSVAIGDPGIAGSRAA